MKVIFVGSNPSRLNEDPSVAFIGSRSYPVLQYWSEILEVSDYEMINVSSKVGKVLEKDIEYDYLRESTEGRLVIALGRIASKALAKLQIQYFSLPHPSPKNRLLNDKAYVEDKLAECKAWLSKN